VGSGGHGKPGKVMEFLLLFSRSGKVLKKTETNLHIFGKSHGNVIFMCSFTRYVYCNLWNSQVLITGGGSGAEKQTGLNMNNEKLSLMRQKFPKKRKSPKGGWQAGSNRKVRKTQGRRD